VPANPSALIEARSAGIDTRPLEQWAEKVLDSGARRTISRRALEILRSSAAEPAHRIGPKKQETREERVRYAERVQLSLKRPAGTPAERRAEVADILRKVRAEGWP
jgi:hypothetical protein